jgi:hypothetical protein
MARRLWSFRIPGIVTALSLPGSELPQGSSRNILERFVTLGLVAATLVSIATYFWALSQYSTADQTATAKRLEAFVTNVRSIQLSDGSLISDLLVAYPAKWLDKALSHFYQLNDLIVWDIHFTPILPFTLVQVVVALLFMAYLAALVVRLALPGRWQPIPFLLVLLVVMNFPMLKGIAKVLKYDIFSTLFAAIAILHYA